MSVMSKPPHDPSLPRAFDGCTCDCHSSHGVMHCVPCCGPGAPKMEPRSLEAEAQLQAFLTSRAVSADALKQLERRGYDVWTQLALQEGPTQATEMQVAEHSLTSREGREAFDRGWKRAISEWEANPFRQKGYEAWIELWTSYGCSPNASLCPARHMKEGLDRMAFIAGWNKAKNENQGTK